MAEFCGDGDTQRLARQIAHLPVEDVIAVAGRALPSLSRADRTAVGAALASCGFAGAILRRFARSHENRRILHCELLGTIGGDDAAAGLQDALKDRAGNVRIAAAIALVELGRILPLPRLLARLGRDARGSSRLVYLLEKLVPHCEAQIVQLATDFTPEPRLRISALQALALASPATHRALLVRLGRDPCPQTAVAVARMLGRETGVEPGAVLISMLSHPSPSVRREAAAAIGSSGVVSAAPALTRITGDPDPAAAAAAARSLWLLRQQVRHDRHAAGEAA